MTLQDPCCWCSQYHNCGNCRSWILALKSQYGFADLWQRIIAQRQAQCEECYKGIEDKITDNFLSSVDRPAVGFHSVHTNHSDQDRWQKLMWYLFATVCAITSSSSMQNCPFVLSPTDRSLQLSLRHFRREEMSTWLDNLVWASTLSSW